MPINCNEPTKDEIRKAVKQLKSSNAAGPDSIPAEVLKINTETTVEMFHPLFKKIWQEKQVPAE